MPIPADDTIPNTRECCRKVFAPSRNSDSTVTCSVTNNYRQCCIENKGLAPIHDLAGQAPVLHWLQSGKRASRSRAKLFQTNIPLTDARLPSRPHRGCTVQTRSPNRCADNWLRCFYQVPVNKHLIGFVPRKKKIGVSRTHASTLAGRQGKRF
jgi:hypothetical protein